MKTEHIRILVECLARQHQFAKCEPPPAWKTWLVAEHECEAEHGPFYGCGEWFGDVGEAARQRFRRAIDDLEHAGAIETWKRFGTKLSNIKLTAAGEALARRLAQRLSEIHSTTTQEPIP